MTTGNIPYTVISHQMSSGSSMNNRAVKIVQSQRNLLLLITTGIAGGMYDLGTPTPTVHLRRGQPLTPPLCMREWIVIMMKSGLACPSGVIMQLIPTITGDGPTIATGIISLRNVIYCTYSRKWLDYLKISAVMSYGCKCVSKMTHVYVYYPAIVNTWLYWYELLIRLHRISEMESYHLWYQWKTCCLFTISI